MMTTFRHTRLSITPPPPHPAGPALSHLTTHSSPLSHSLLHSLTNSLSPSLELILRACVGSQRKRKVFALGYTVQQA